jgi:hypothetical protein
MGCKLRALRQRRQSLVGLFLTEQRNAKLHVRECELVVRDLQTPVEVGDRFFPLVGEEVHLTTVKENVCRPK